MNEKGHLGNTSVKFGPVISGGNIEMLQPNGHRQLPL
jgi:hypothetical protein